jgi:hypothetical protein
MFDFNFSTGRPTCFAADNQLKKSAGPRSNGFLLAGRRLELPGAARATSVACAWDKRRLDRSFAQASATIRLVSIRFYQLIALRDSLLR